MPLPSAPFQFTAVDLLVVSLVFAGAAVVCVRARAKG
jgi:hypothetical protein